MNDGYSGDFRVPNPDGASIVNSDSVLTPTHPVQSHLQRLGQGFPNLMNDVDGQNLFEEYAKLNQIDDYLMFWFAIEGFCKRYKEIEKKKREGKCNQLFFETETLHMAKAIYNNFIKDNAKSKVYLWFSNLIRETIYQKIQKAINSKDIFDINIFLDAKIQFEKKIQENIYPDFLKSDIYAQYVRNVENIFSKGQYLENVKNSQISNYNPTCSIKNHNADELSKNKSLHEVLKQNKINQQPFMLNLKNTHPIINPFHLPYTNFHPGSTRDSDIQSMSPGASDLNLLDQHKLKLDLKKVKKENGDCFNSKGKTYLTIEQETVERTIQHLCSAGARSHLPNIPTDDMEKVKSFIAKLEKINREKMKESEKKILQAIEKIERNGKPNSSLRKVIKSKTLSKDSQSILDEHCLRVFKSNETPNRTSGYATPKSAQKAHLNKQNKIGHNLITNNFCNNNSILGDALINKLTMKCKSSRANGQQSNNYHFVESFNTNHKYNHNNNPLNQISSNFTIIKYQYTNEIPYSIKLSFSPITLKQFKQEIIKKNIDSSKQRMRYFFKKKDEDEDENIYTMQEITDDNELLPYCNGKIYAKIEIVSINS